MKSNKPLIWSFAVLVIVASVYRAIPGRPYGFAPQIAMALFSGVMIKDRKWSFALPLLSMLLSDILYEVLYSYHITPIKGFYGAGQIENYLLIAGVTAFGFLMRKVNVLNVFLYSLITPALFFLASNGLIWIEGGVDIRTLKPLSRGIDGLMQCYIQAWPFYEMSVLSTVFFSALFFGGYYLFTKKLQPAQA